MYEKLRSGTEHVTRSSKLHKVEWSHVDEARLSIVGTSWRWRGNSQHSGLPDYLKNEKEIGTFKLGLKNWVKENILI